MFQTCTDACGWMAALVAALAYGSFGVPVKATKHIDVHPLVLQSYKTLVVFIMSWGVIFFGVEVGFTKWGILSGLLWVVGGTGGIYGIRMAGLAVAVGTWASIMIMVNFIFGIMVFQEPVHDVLGTLASFLLLIVGLIGMSRYSAPPPALSMQTEQDILSIDHHEEAAPSTSFAPMEDPTTDQAAQPVQLKRKGSDNTSNGAFYVLFGIPLSKRQCGILGAAMNGVFTGGSLVPLHYAKEEGFGGANFIISMASGAFITNCLIWVVIFFYNMASMRLSVLDTVGSMPKIYFDQLWLPGSMAGVLLGIAMFGSILAVTYLGQGVGNSLVQTKILVSGLWGIFWYKEITGAGTIAKWFLSATIAMVAIIWLSLERLLATGGAGVMTDNGLRKPNNAIPQSSFPLTPPQLWQVDENNAITKMVEETKTTEAAVSKEPEDKPEDETKEKDETETPQEDNAPQDTLPPSSPPHQTETSQKSSTLPSAPASPPRRVSKRIKIREQSKPTPKIFHDSVTVVIPLTVAADLRVAIQHTRTKRIQSIYKQFPALKKAAKKALQQRNDMDDENRSHGDAAAVDDDDDGEGEDDLLDKNGQKDGKGASKKQKKLTYVPRPDQYGSVLDYLEAKYVRGVQLSMKDDDEVMEAGTESVHEGGSEEGQGSVYSSGSFLDDTDLQRDVAEQVMANTTLTKLELEDDDGEFFVNVGNLEVEENQYGDDYDPLQDKEAKQTTTKKRKKPTGEGGETKKKKTSTDSADALATTSTSKQTTATAGTKKSTKSSATAKSDEDPKTLKLRAKKAKAKVDAIFKTLSDIVDQMGEAELPRRKTKLKVSLTCPQNKQPGDDVTFTNPHNPGQRLRVKVPKECFPGGTFKVTVPVKPPSKEELENTDHNKFPREFQNNLADYAQVYDRWCAAQAALDKSFALGKEKQSKFDTLIAKFPKNLLTPVDSEYVKKLLRRARQNIHKRKLAAETAKVGESGNDGDTIGGESDKASVVSGKKQSAEAAKKGEVVDIPTPGNSFPTVQWKEDDFVMTDS
eukprot:Nitzschia sp. Nitz4//scaffold33_size148984//5131//8657//NITZ4_002909-RA/size148984-augustus-gene-0.251-mRNA-1//1//CDS//3329548370//4275//frame0